MVPPASLADVLRDPTGLFCFREYMERQRATALINFWVTVEGYSAATAASTSSTGGSTGAGTPRKAGAHSGTTDDDVTLRKDTAVLYAQYFAPDAAHLIQLPRPLLVGLRAYIDSQVRA
jgi:hypothetical protein